MKLRVPERFQQAELSGLTPRFKPVIEYAKLLRDYVDDGVGLLLVGSPGVGKSWAVAALTKFYTTQYIRGDYEYQTSHRLVENLEAVEGEGKWDIYRDQPWQYTLETVSWLVINDLGKEYSGGKLSEQNAYKIGRLLRVRSERLLVTHITTNMSGKEIKEKYGETFSSLLSEMTKLVVVLGKDRRVSP